MERDPYAGLAPPEIWRHFAALNAIPRPSGQEDAAREYVQRIAEAAGAGWVVDAHGNALVRVPGRAGTGAREPVAIQTHLDMVCDSVPEVEHDCAHDPIVARRDGDRICARGTTLGADNGIGVAMALALLTEPGVVHGPLELVFTVEEEIGLQGALSFDASLLRAQSLINLDSEDEAALTVGSAGGSDILLRLPVESGRLPEGWIGAELRVSGLTGGHSGVQIHEHRANAIKLLVTVLDRIREDGVQLRLASCEGGSAHNAIPREAVACLAIPEDAKTQVAQVVSDAKRELELAWGTDEPGLTITFESLTQRADDAATDEASAKLTQLLRDLPHGVIAMSSRFPNTVETSANLALLRTDAGTVTILTSIRSSSPHKLRAVETQIRTVAAAASASVEATGGYPPWQPREDSALLATARSAYRRVYGRKPRIELVHGGLECGVLVAAKPDLDAVSFGPSISEAHTPREHVYASTVATTWELLVTILAKLAANH